MLSDSHHKHHKNQPANESDQSFAEMMQEPVKFIWIKEKLKWGQLLWHWIKQIQQTQYWGLRVTIHSSVYLNAVWPVTRTLDGRFQKACRPFFFSEGNMEMPFVPEGLDIWLQSVSWALKQPSQVFLATRLSTSWLMELEGNFHQKVAGVPANGPPKVHWRYKWSRVKADGICQPCGFV